MSKIDRIGYYDKKTGDIISDEIYKAIKSESDKIKYKNIFNKLNSNPLDLTLEEFEIIRKLQNKRYPHKVNLKYAKGFFMNSQNEECIFEELHELSVYLLHMCGYRMNKDGLLKYKNGRAIKKMSDLKSYFNFSKYKWSIIKKDIDKYKLIKEQPHDNTTYLVMNPLYTSSQYEITMYKFMAFHKELKDHLDELDYLYLCKKFDIIP